VNDPHKKAPLVSVFSSVLILTFYGRMNREACTALVLCSVSLVFLGGGIYFLRVWLPSVFVRALAVLFVAAAAQAAWIKQGLEPWWALAVLGVLLPAVSEIRQPMKTAEFAGQAMVLAAAALCFFAARSALELTASQIFWEQPAGHWSLLGLIALAVGVIETREAPRGA